MSAVSRDESNKSVEHKKKKSKYMLSQVTVCQSGIRRGSL